MSVALSSGLAWDCWLMQVTSCMSEVTECECSGDGGVSPWGLTRLCSTSQSGCGQTAGRSRSRAVGAPGPGSALWRRWRCPAHSTQTERDSFNKTYSSSSVLLACLRACTDTHGCLFDSESSRHQGWSCSRRERSHIICLLVPWQPRLWLYSL